jgi:hypothetical protein
MSLENGKIYMSENDYKKLHKDYRGFVDGIPYALALDNVKGTVYAPVVFTGGEQ